MPSYTFYFGDGLLPPSLTWPTPSGITEDEARTACEGALTGSAVYDLCAGHTEDNETSALVSSCMVELLVSVCFCSSNFL